MDNGSTDNYIIASLEVSPDTFTCANLGLNTVTLTVIDSSGNTDTCLAMVTIVDTIPPVALGKDITVQLDAAGTISITGSQVDGGSSDNCGIAALTVNPSTFTCADVGANSVSLKVVDLSGNTNACSLIVTVEDKVAPVILGKDISIQLDVSGNSLIAPDDVDNGSSDACGILSLELSKTAFSCNDLGPNIVTLTATDIHGNSSSGESTITVKDVIPPDLTITSITGDQNGLGENEYWLHNPVLINYLVSDACDPDPVISTNLENVSIDQALKTVTIPPYTLSGEITITITAVDSSNNSQSASQTITLVGGMPEVIIKTLQTTKQGYFPEDEVNIEVTLENISPFIARDLVLKTMITDPLGALVNQTEEAIPEVESEVPLPYLYKYKYYLPTDAPTGIYSLEAELSTNQGITLDTQSTTFGVGQPKIEDFSVNSISFNQNQVKLSTNIKNYSLTSSYDIVRTIRLIDFSGVLVGEESSTLTLLADGTSKTLPIFDITGWPAGEYKAEMLVNDSYTGQLYDSAELFFFISILSIDLDIAEPTYAPGQQVSITAVSENAGDQDFEVVISLEVKDYQGNIIHSMTDGPFILPKMSKKQPTEHITSTTIDLPLEALLGNYIVTATLAETGGNVLNEDTDIFAVIGRIQFKSFSLAATEFTQEQASTDGVLLERLQICNYDSQDHIVKISLSLVDAQENEIVSQIIEDELIKAGKRANFTGTYFVLPDAQPGSYKLTGTVKNEVGIAWDRQEVWFEIIP